MKRTTWYSQFAKWGARISGRPISFILALGLIAAWIVTGPIFHFSDTWRLVLNTLTTMVTFLMVSFLQHTQNRDTEGMQVELDGLIGVRKGADNVLLDLEE